METFNRKDHWEKIYQTKSLEQVSWYQKVPTTSLQFIKELQIEKTAKIIDVGGGDSYLVDHLLDLGYQNITVLDISQAAILRAQERLGTKAHQVTWVVADAAHFVPEETYDFWHDRAAFHFLTLETEIEQYLQTIQQHLSIHGKLVLGTFSEQGPTKCSGIPIQQYSEKAMVDRLGNYFKPLQCIQVNHQTPFDTVQNFTFCSFSQLPLN